MDFAGILKSKRNGRNVKDLAEKAGLSYSFWYEMERNQAVPTIAKLPDIARALECDPKDLIPDEEKTFQK